MKIVTARKTLLHRSMFGLDKVMSRSVHNSFVQCQSGYKAAGLVNVSVDRRCIQVLIVTFISSDS